MLLSAWWRRSSPSLLRRAAAAAITPAVMPRLEATFTQRRNMGFANVWVDEATAAQRPKVRPRRRLSRRVQDKKFIPWVSPSKRKLKMMRPDRSAEIKQEEKLRRKRPQLHEVDVETVKARAGIRVVGKTSDIDAGVDGLVRESKRFRKTEVLNYKPAKEPVYRGTWPDGTPRLAGREGRLRILDSGKILGRHRAMYIWKYGRPERIKKKVRLEKIERWRINKELYDENGEPTDTGAVRRIREKKEKMMMEKSRRKRRDRNLLPTTSEDSSSPFMVKPEETRKVSTMFGEVDVTRVRRLRDYKNKLKQQLEESEKAVRLSESSRKGIAAPSEDGKLFLEGEHRMPMEVPRVARKSQGGSLKTLGVSGDDGSLGSRRRTKPDVELSGLKSFADGTSSSRTVLKTSVGRALDVVDGRKSPATVGSGERTSTGSRTTQVTVGSGDRTSTGSRTTPVRVGSGERTSTGIRTTQVTVGSGDRTSTGSRTTPVRVGSGEKTSSDNRLTPVPVGSSERTKARAETMALELTDGIGSGVSSERTKAKKTRALKLTDGKSLVGSGEISRTTPVPMGSGESGSRTTPVGSGDMTKAKADTTKLTDAKSLAPYEDRKAPKALQAASSWKSSEPEVLSRDPIVSAEILAGKLQVKQALKEMNTADKIKETKATKRSEDKRSKGSKPASEISVEDAKPIISKELPDEAADADGGLDDDLTWVLPAKQRLSTSESGLKLAKLLGTDKLMDFPRLVKLKKPRPPPKVALKKAPFEDEDMLFSAFQPAPAPAPAPFGDFDPEKAPVVVEEASSILHEIRQRNYELRKQLEDKAQADYEALVRAEMAVQVKRQRVSKRLIRDTNDPTSKRIDDNPRKPVLKEPGTNAKFRMIQPPFHIVSYINSQMLGKRRLEEWIRRGYNLKYYAALDNVPFHKGEERHKIQQSVFRNKHLFVAAAASLSSIPPAELPEIAFAGRSNAGKSKLINALTRHWGTARTSPRPGTTKTINFYVLGKKMCMVDLPGYSFMYGKEEKVAEIKQLTKDYITLREELKRVLVLVDAQWGFKHTDREFIEFLESINQKYQLVLTKADKVMPLDLARRATQAEELLKDSKSHVRPVMMVSSRHGSGLGKLRKCLASIID